MEAETTTIFRASLVDLIEMTDETLSSLSTAEEMDRIFSAGTPQTSKIPSRILR